MNNNWNPITNRIRNDATLPPSGIAHTPWLTIKVGTIGVSRISNGLFNHVWFYLKEINNECN